jgi:hypothetical protein
MIWGPFSGRSLDAENDESRMNNLEGMPNVEITTIVASIFRHSWFVLLSRFVIRHSSLTVGANPRPNCR